MTPGEVFPPRDAWDVIGYPSDDTIEGYREASLLEPPPGDNRPPGYRWGWANWLRDHQHQDDGFDRIRRETARLLRMPQ